MSPNLQTNFTPCRFTKAFSAKQTNKQTNKQKIAFPAQKNEQTSANLSPTKGDIGKDEVEIGKKKLNDKLISPLAK